MEPKRKLESSEEERVADERYLEELIAAGIVSRAEQPGPLPKVTPLPSNGISLSSLIIESRR